MTQFEDSLIQFQQGPAPEPEVPPETSEVFIYRHGQVFFWYSMWLLGRLHECMGPDEEPRKTWDELAGGDGFDPEYGTAIGHAARWPE